VVYIHKAVLYNPFLGISSVDGIDAKTRLFRLFSQDLSRDVGSRDLLATAC
jgi:hypothetical protein